ncbi:hypothetical protein A6A06_24660 [Streptomyces sp. CB02923]|uniref:hypothetical protein n=1 Tax=Streptomyces sp. CB02923 TaxID=1718985 RepID=UPI00093A65E8|nr:hypothetical protein [Streptomyces sp. CB02923]OKI00447.1 hypothetical protein A6A06_24660 [Streptomyces sp. CB02923]
MTYAVTVDTSIPVGSPEMDALQRAGAVALLEKGISAVEGIEGPDGMEVDIFESIVAVHPGGALLTIFVDAPALEFAEDSVQSVVGELLERSELLAEWTIDRCEVQLHPQLTQESLDAADGPDTPPTDAAARKAHHATRSGDSDGQDDYDAEAEAQAVRSRMLTMSAELRSFPPVMFGVLDPEDEDGEEEDVEAGVLPEDAKLAAGALVYGAHLLVDELFQDVQTLTQTRSNVAECERPLWLLEELPDRYAPEYDAHFARRFLVTAIAMTTRFTHGSFQQLSCLAEELALRLLLREANVSLETFGLMDEGVAAALEAFAENVYEDMDHEWLYDDSVDEIGEDAAGEAFGVTPMAIGSWFTPFNEGRYVHPYAVEAPEDAAQ